MTNCSELYNNKFCIKTSSFMMVIEFLGIICIIQQPQKSKEIWQVIYMSWILWNCKGCYGYSCDIIKLHKFFNKP
jgi:hypothetical protein